MAKLLEQAGWFGLRMTGVAACACAAIAAAQAQTGPASVAQQEAPTVPATHTLRQDPGQQQLTTQYTGAEALLRNPVSNLFPGGVSLKPDIKNPVGDDPAAAQRGMGYFLAFNCVGCHAANAGGGMGPALSNSFFLYGGDPANIYMTIAQGRPNGMPAWGGILPDAVIWDLVAYVKQLSNEPQTGSWGQTISPDAMKIEQAPAEFTTTPNPWAYTEPFSRGQKPGSGGRPQ